MTNYPPGVLPNDRRAPWNEPEHYTRCPQHQDWKPELDTLLDEAREIVNVYDEEGLKSSDYSSLRLKNAIDRLREILEPPCSCDEIDRGMAEAAEDFRAEERADREDFA